MSPEDFTGKYVITYLGTLSILGRIGILTSSVDRDLKKNKLVEKTTVIKTLNLT